MQSDQSVPIFYPPKPSRQTRQFGVRSAGCARATVVADDIQIACESGLEMKAAVELLADPDVVDVWEQPNPVVYRGVDGEVVQHWPDFLVTHADGTKTVVQVKPESRADKARVQAKILAEQAPNYADGFDVVTDGDLGRTAVHDAALVHDMRRHDDPVADDAVRSLIDELRGTTTVGSLVDGSGCGPAGFAAVIRLIGDGILRKATTKRLSYASLVRHVDAPALGRGPARCT